MRVVAYRCWNTMGAAQQEEVIVTGRFDSYDPHEGGCTSLATVAVELADDRAPEPRWYCLACAVDYLADRLDSR